MVFWIPAFAGMTKSWIPAAVYPGENRGLNDEELDQPNL